MEKSVKTYTTSLHENHLWPMLYKLGRPPAGQDLFAVRGNYCPLGVSYVKFCLVFENLLPVCGTASVTEIWVACYFTYGEKS